MSVSSSKLRLVVFTNNANKLQEIREILSDFPGEVLGYRDVFPAEVDVVEDGLTFAENVIKKVNALPSLPDTYYLADDSGMEVDALDNRPGVFSARYGGDISMEDKCRLILKELEGVTRRSARFFCVIAIRFPSSQITLCEGVLDGKIAPDIRGKNGFGYDPIFIPRGYTETFGEMTVVQKHALSHRGQALAKLAAVLKEH